MKRNMLLLAALAVLASALPAATKAATQVYDLKADWSDTQNPNGTWSYRSGESLLPNDQFAWGSFDDFKPGKDGLTKATSADVLPGYLELGDVFVSADADYYDTEVIVRWTAPANGAINLSGEAWNGGGGYCWVPDALECASYRWMLTHNGITLSDGWTGGTRDLPYDFSAGSEGAPALQEIQVLAGDEIDLVFVGDISGGNVGVNFTITLTPDSVDPAAAIQQLAETVAAMNLQNGIENSLDAKLDSALNALDDVNENNDGAACNSLDAFINAVEAQRGNKLTDAQADQLIASAQEIQTSLNCGN